MARASSRMLSWTLALGIVGSALPATADPGGASLSGLPLTWSTFAGGTSTDYGAGVATDASGNVYLVGTTSSADYPTTAGALQRAKGLDRDVFVTKLGSDGTTLLWSTLLGGNGTDNGLAVAVDAAGNVFVTGSTSSTDFPTTAGALRITYAGGTSDGFVAKIAADGSRLLYSTYLAGSLNDLALSIAVDGSDNATVGGYSGSTDFPTTPGALRTSRAGGFPDVADGFVSKLAADGSRLIYSTYLGVDGGTDEVFGVALDALGRATVTGMTESPAFPTTVGAFDRTYGHYWDGFVARLNETGSALVYSTYLGGTGDDQPWGVALDAGGYAYVTGWTSSADFPTTSGALQRTYGGGAWDTFVARLAPDGSALGYATFLGGTGSDQAYALTLATGGRACVTGTTDSGNFPIAGGAYDGSANGGQDAFVACLSSTGGELSYSSYLGGSGTEIGRAIAVRPDLNVALMGYSNSAAFPTTPSSFDPTLNGAGTFDCFATVINAGLGSVTAVPPGIPTTLQLSPPAPNPFVTGTEVELSLERPAHVTARVLDLGGRLVRVLEDRDLPSGSHGWAWDGHDARGASAGSGVFFVEVVADGERVVRSVVKLR